MKRNRWLAVASLVLGMSLAACGDDKDDEVDRCEKCFECLQNSDASISACENICNQCDGKY